MTPHPHLSAAFPAIATQIQEKMPLLADACSRLTVDLSTDKEIALRAATNTDYEILTTGDNMNRLSSLFALPEGHLFSINRPLELLQNAEESYLGAPVKKPLVPRAAKKTSIKLTTPQSFKLLDWMRQREQECRDQPDAQLAKRASADLDFEITVTNFTHARTSAAIAKTEPPKPKTQDELMAELRHELTTCQHLLTGVLSVLEVNLGTGALTRPGGREPGMDLLTAALMGRKAGGLLREALQTSESPVPPASDLPGLDSGKQP
jgi:hypothetical protein